MLIGAWRYAGGTTHTWVLPYLEPGDLIVVGATDYFATMQPPTWPRALLRTTQLYFGWKVIDGSEPASLVISSMNATYALSVGVAFRLPFRPGRPTLRSGSTVPDTNIPPPDEGLALAWWLTAALASAPVPSKVLLDMEQGRLADGSQWNMVGRWNQAPGSRGSGALASGACAGYSIVFPAERHPDHAART